MKKRLLGLAFMVMALVALLTIGVSGTEQVVNTETEFIQAMQASDGSSNASAYIKLGADITFDVGNDGNAYTWLIEQFWGTLDGDGHTLTIVNNSGANYFLLKFINGSACVKDLNIMSDGDNASNLSMFINAYSGTPVILDNVDILDNPEKIYAIGNNESPYTACVGGYLQMIDCDNHQSYNSATYCAVFIGGYMYGGNTSDGGYTSGTAKVDFENCNNYGDFYAKNASMFLGNATTSYHSYATTSAVTVIDCHNYAVISGTSGVGTFGNNSTSSNFELLEAAYLTSDIATGSGEFILADYSVSGTVAADGRFIVADNEDNTAASYGVYMAGYAKNDQTGATYLNGVQFSFVALEELNAMGVRYGTLIDSTSFATEYPNTETYAPSWDVGCDGGINEMEYQIAVVEDTLYYVLTIDNLSNDNTYTMNTTPTIITVMAYNENGSMIGSETLTSISTVTIPSIVCTVNGGAFVGTLAEAVAAANDGDTVTLLTDVAEDITIATGQEIILDLNGNTLTSASTHTIINEGVLTINDNVGTGTVDCVVHENAAIYNHADATATLNGGKFTRSLEGETNSWYTVWNAGTLTVNENVVIENAAASSSTMINYGTGEEAAILTINGGTFTGGMNTVKNDDNAVLNIHGGNFTNIFNGAAVICNYATVDITGGTFTTLDDGSHKSLYCDEGLGQRAVATVSGGTFNGMVLIWSGDTETKISEGTFNSQVVLYGGTGTLEITGGTFTATASVWISDTASEAGAKIMISGGEYTAAPAETCIATGYCVSDAVNSDNYWYITNETIAQVEDALADMEDLDDSGIIDLAADIVVYDSETLAEDADIVESLNVLDALFTEATGALATGAVEPTVLEESAIAETAVEVSGLALSVYGGKTGELTVEATTTVYIAVSELDADANALLDDVELDETAIALEIKPMEKVNDGVATEIENASLQTPVTFKIYLSENFEGNRATVYHITESGAVKTYTCTVNTDGTGKYIQMTVTEFSKFILEPWTYTASSGSSNMGTIVNPDATTTTTPDTTDEEETGFVDVDGDDYFYDAVQWAVENGVTTGKTGTTFAPEDFATRADVLTFLYRGFGAPETDGENVFEDVVEGSYYSDAVSWGIEMGITNGIGNGLFGSEKTCTRAQIITFLWRAAGAPEVDGDHDFTDVEVGSYYEMALLWAVENGITNGLGDGTFGVDESCTRAQIVTFLYRYFN